MGWGYLITTNSNTTVFHGVFALVPDFLSREVEWDGGVLAPLYLFDTLSSHMLVPSFATFYDSNWPISIWMIRIPI